MQAGQIWCVVNKGHMLLRVTKYKTQRSLEPREEQGILASESIVESFLKM